MNFTLVELTRINLMPGEVLSVKLYGDDYEDMDLAGLQKSLESMFPNNKVMMFVLPAGKDLQMEVISGNLENKPDMDLAPELAAHQSQRAALMDSLNELKTLAKQPETPKADCSTVNYCNDCSCGKKATAEAENDLNKSKG